MLGHINFSSDIVLHVGKTEWSGVEFIRAFLIATHSNGVFLK